MVDSLIDKVNDYSAIFLRISITGNCISNCVFCDPKGNIFSNNGLSKEKWIQILEAGSNIRILEVHYTGGEPTLRNDLIEIITRARELGYNKQSMTTNGFLLDEQRLDNLVEAGLNRINLSIHTLKLDTFQNLISPNPNYFYKQMAAIPLVAKRFDPVKINFVVLKQNIAEIPAMIEYCQTNGLILRLLELNRYGIPFVDNNNSFSEYHVSEKEIREMIEGIGTLTECNSLPQGHNAVAQYFILGNSGMPIALIPFHSKNYLCDINRCSYIRINPFGIAKACVNPEMKMHQLVGDNISLDQTIEILRALADIKIGWKSHGGNPNTHIPDYSGIRAGNNYRPLTAELT